MLGIAFGVVLAIQESPDPNRLKIGREGEAVVQVGQIYDLRNNRPASLSDVVSAAKGKKWVFLGENHATTAHQQMQAAVIAALLGGGRKVAVGLEMYQRPKQTYLDQWAAGTLGEEEFLTQSDWKGQWGFDFSFYRPVFNVVQANRIPLVGLNVPRDWVRIVGRQGFAGLPADAKSQLPAEMDLSNARHRAVFAALLGGHPMTGPTGENMYSAQVLWDEGMADTALGFMSRDAEKGRVFVVIAGSGHVMYGQGINYRVARRKGGDGVTVVMIQGNGPVTVSRGLGDFVYVSREQDKPAGG